MHRKRQLEDAEEPADKVKIEDDNETAKFLELWRPRWQQWKQVSRKSKPLSLLQPDLPGFVCCKSFMTSPAPDIVKNMYEEECDELEEFQWNHTMINVNEVSVIVDLTDSASQGSLATYSDPKALAEYCEKSGIVLIKIPLPTGPPAKDIVGRFNGLVQKFLEKFPAKQILVMDEFGYLQGGFLVCSYLVDVLEWSPDAALSIFAASRPPGLFLPEFINAFYNQFDEEYQGSYPAVPEWFAKISKIADDSEHTRKKSKANHEVNNVKSFYTPPPNVLLTYRFTSRPTAYFTKEGKMEKYRIPPPRRYPNSKTLPDLAFESYKPPHIRQQDAQKEAVTATTNPVNTFLGYPEAAEDKTSVLKSRIEELLGEAAQWPPRQATMYITKEVLSELDFANVKLTWKPQCSGMLLYISEDRTAYLIDEQWHIFHFNDLTYPPEFEAAETIITGELVYDRIPKALKPIPRLLLSDLIVYKSLKFIEQIDGRIHLLDSEILARRLKPESMKLRMRTKFYLPAIVKSVDKLLSSILPELPHQHLCVEVCQFQTDAGVKKYDWFYNDMRALSPGQFKSYLPS